LKEFKTEERLNKITRVIRSRQFSLNVVLENIHDPHNVSAIFRTCDAAGIPEISLLYNNEEFPKISKVSSASAMKWVKTKKYSDTAQCFEALRGRGYRIYATALANGSKNLYDLDLTKKTAFVMGNEHRGVSEEAAGLADELISIPMYGMIQSLNVSVATAVICYEALRQRLSNGMYSKSELTEDELNCLIDEWCDK
jgi:tRNA (guanosine-2'-O-)-methyltransferase